MRRFDKKIWILSILFFCISIAGCEKAPERSEDNNVEQKVGLSSEQYVTVEEAKEQVHQLEGKKINGFGFPEHITMPDGNLEEVKLLPWKSDKKEAFETALQGIWSDYNTVDWSSIQKSKNTIYVEEHNRKYFGDDWFYEAKEDEKTGISYGYDAFGGFFGDSLNGSMLTCDYCEMEYDFEWGDTASLGDVYQLEDGESSVAEAVSYTENLFNQYLSEMEKNQFTYKVQHLYVVPNDENGCYDFNISIGRVYKGAFVETSHIFALDGGKPYKKCHGGASFEVVMRHTNKLDYVNVCNELWTAETEAEMEKIISPLWAVQQMNQVVAHLGGMNFVDCGLVYVLVQDNEGFENNEQGITQDVITYDALESSESSDAPDTESELRPVWLFMSPASGIENWGTTRNHHGASVVIDAIDGTLYYYERVQG